MPTTERKLTHGEIAAASSVFGTAIDYGSVRIRHRRWWPLQPRNTIMAPCGHVHVHPQSALWSDDYSTERVELQGLLVHELTHVLQAQERGRFYLPLMRHPFCRYDYTIAPGKDFDSYGIEQQAEIVRHAFLARLGRSLPHMPSRDELESIVGPRFGPPPLIA
jgi:hypothetical protein